ncbi:MAG: dihydrolipoamide acetyltransferase family protein [Anaerolineales bacterium]|nr:dihydrolipoamide acetyltransferase family protein [Anaerolineales bacterium]
MPDLGATGGDARLEAWLVQPGESVQAGQPLFVVVTDKATVEVEAFRGGVLREIKVAAGQDVPLGAVVAMMADSLDEPLPEDQGPAQGGRDQARQSDQPEYAAGNGGSAGRVRASPVARRLAVEAGIDLGALSGTGRQGQILRRDVEEAIRALSAGQAEAVKDAIPAEPLSAMRRSIAARTVQSKQEIPHFYAGAVIDMAEAVAFRQEVVRRAEVHGRSKPTITDLCLRAAALSLAAFPALNASFINNAIVSHPEINIGFVVGLQEGMLIPVVRQADRLGLYQLAAESKRLKAAAEAGQLRADDITGGTFTLSNLGMLGLDWFAPIINPPEAGILALGAVKERPAVVDGQLAARLQMDVTLAVDHRLVDGVVAARFLAAYKDVLENPLDLVLEDSEEWSS